MTRYKVTCNSCGGFDELQIDNVNKRVFFTKHFPIIAARYRPDLNWGFECGACANDSRLAKEEREQAELLVSGSDKKTIKEMVKNLEKKPNTKFSMVAL